MTEIIRMTGDSPRRRRERYRRREYSRSPPPKCRRSPSRSRSPPYRRRRSYSPPFQRSRRVISPRERRFGYDQYDRDERPHGRHAGRSSSSYPSRADYYVPNAGSSKREGLMSYKQFIQELEDDILPSEAAQHKYHDYKSEYISTQKRAYFNAHKDEEWLKDKYHPTNLVTVIERRNDLARKNAEEFLLDLQSGNLDLGPGLQNQNSGDEADDNGRKRRIGKSQANHSSAPKANPVSSDPIRVQLDIEQSQALMRKLDSEKGIEYNILSNSENGRSSRDRSHSIELLDTVITYLWRVHGVDYYGLVESSQPKGLRHVSIDGKRYNALDTRWRERMGRDDPLEVRAAKEKIDGAAVEALDPYVRKIRDEKYGWKYGCGAKGCTKLFHGAEFVHKHLKLKHTDLVIELTSKVREDLYFENYMDDEDAPGGTPVMQPSMLKEMPLRRRSIQSRLKDDRDADGRDRSLPFDDVSSGGNADYLVFDSQGLHRAPPLLMPAPGAGPLGPFVPAPPEVAMIMLRELGGPIPFEGSGKNGRTGQGNAPILALPPKFQLDPRRLRSYQDLDVPDDEITVIDYRSL